MLMLFTYIPSNVSSNKYEGKLDRRPWSYGDLTLQTFRKYLQLRHSLIPYFYTLAEEAHGSGAPLVRPLLYEFPRDERAWDIEDQYLLGGDLLIAPVMEKGAYAREVYLPQAQEWVDFWSQQVYAGGQTIQYDAPADALPLLVRRGAILPTQDPLLTLSNHPYPEITWRIYLSDRQEAFELYEDDGLMQDYKMGKTVRTRVFALGGPRPELRLQAEGQRERRHTFQIHLLPEMPKTVVVGSRKLRVQAGAQKRSAATVPEARWDRPAKILTLVVPRLPETELVIQLY
jgi:hypothetical protein